MMFVTRINDLLSNSTYLMNISECACACSSASSNVGNCRDYYLAPFLADSQKLTCQSQTLQIFTNVYNCLLVKCDHVIHDIDAYFCKSFQHINPSLRIISEKNSDNQVPSEIKKKKKSYAFFCIKGQTFGNFFCSLLIGM